MSSGSAAEPSNRNASPNSRGRCAANSATGSHLVIPSAWPITRTRRTGARWWEARVCAMSPSWVLDEDDALELLAFLITSARTQVDEAAEYGPLRLLTAAHRLGDAVSSRTSEETAALLAGPLRRMP